MVGVVLLFGLISMGILAYCWQDMRLQRQREQDDFNKAMHALLEEFKRKQS